MIERITKNYPLNFSSPPIQTAIKWTCISSVTIFIFSVLKLIFSRVYASSTRTFSLEEAFKELNPNTALRIVPGRERRYVEVDPSINPDQLVTTPFHIAAMLPKNLERLEPILESGSGSFSSTHSAFQNTPLLWAIANANFTGAMAILEVTPQNDPSLNMGVHRGNTALHLAIGKGYDDTNISGEPLAYSSLQLAQKLIEKGCIVNLANEDGNTALHLACLRKNPEMIEMLLNARANCTIKNNDELTPSGLLVKDFEYSQSILRKTVAVFSLVPHEYTDNLEACNKLLSEYMP